MPFLYYSHFYKHGKNFYLAQNSYWIVINVGNVKNILYIFKYEIVRPGQRINVVTYPFAIRCDGDYKYTFLYVQYYSILNTNASVFCNNITRLYELSFDSHTWF